MSIKHQASTIEYGSIQHQASNTGQLSFKHQTHPCTHPPTHTPHHHIQPPTHAPIHSPTHAPTQSPTHAPIHSPTSPTPPAHPTDCTPPHWPHSFVKTMQLSPTTHHLTSPPQAKAIDRTSVFSSSTAHYKASAAIHGNASSCENVDAAI